MYIYIVLETHFMFNYHHISLDKIVELIINSLSFLSEIVCNKNRKVMEEFT